MKILICCLILTQIWSISLLAAPDKQDKQEKTDSQEKLDNNKKMKAFLNKIEVYGRIAKPQTVFIIPGTDPRVSGIKIEKRFFNDIFRKVEKSTLRKEMLKEQRSKDHILW